MMNTMSLSRKLSVTSFSLLIVAFALNIFKGELFGFQDGYAPHELQFSFKFILPIVVLSCLFGVIAILKGLKQSDRTDNNWRRTDYMTFLLSVPGVLIGLVMIAILLFFVVS